MHVRPLWFFRDFAPFCFFSNVPFGPWTIVHGSKK